MLSAWGKKHGKTASVVLLSVFSTLVSVGISWLLRRVSGADTNLQALRYSALIPLIMTPILGYFFIHLLFELDKTKSQLTVLSMTDDLTGVYNRRYFLEQVEKELERAQRYGHAFSLLSFDIDDFKAINDSYGHPAGDKVLCSVAETCKNESRNCDVLARVGGDEFSVLVPELDKEHVLQFAERLVKVLAGSEIVYHGHILKTTVSVGVVSWTPEITDLETMLLLMDRALYVSKESGKNTSNLADVGDIQVDSFVNLN